MLTRPDPTRQNRRQYRDPTRLRPDPTRPDPTRGSSPDPWSQLCDVIRGRSPSLVIIHLKIQCSQVENPCVCPQSQRVFVPKFDFGSPAGYRVYIFIGTRKSDIKSYLQWGMQLNFTGRQAYNSERVYIAVAYVRLLEEVGHDPLWTKK